MKNYWYILGQVSIGLAFYTWFMGGNMQEIQLGYMVAIYALIMDLRSK